VTTKVRAVDAASDLDWSIEGMRQFLYTEADLLDEWRLEEWLLLFTEDCRYVVPSTDDPSADPERHLGLIDDDRTRLSSRVERLLSRRAVREFPLSRTRRLITNVQIEDRSDDRIAIRSSFAVYRFHRGECHEFVGRYRHGLWAGPAGWRIEQRRAELDHELLDPQGTVSIIL
jgi:p-cumate 2,3-dioxygenase beta subunit